MQLTENYYLDIEADNVALTFTEIRERNKKDGTKEEYVFTDQWHYPTVLSALKKYVDLEQRQAKDILECIALTESLFKKIDLIKLEN